MIRYLLCIKELSCCNFAEGRDFCQLIYDEIDRIIMSRDNDREIASLSDMQRKELWLIPDGNGLIFDSRGLHVNRVGLNGMLMDYMSKVAHFVLERLLRKINSQKIKCGDDLRSQLEFSLNYSRSKKVFPLVIDITNNKEKSCRATSVSKADKLDFFDIIEVEFYHAILKLSNASNGSSFCLSPNFLKKLRVVVHKEFKQDNAGSFFKTTFDRSAISIDIKYPMIRDQVSCGLTLDAVVSLNNVLSYTSSKKRFYTKSGFRQLSLKRCSVKDILRFEATILVCQLVVWVLRNHQFYCSSAFQYLNLSKQNRNVFHFDHIELSKNKPNEIFDMILKQQGFELETAGIYHV